jgi:hypothetical protein
MAIELSITLTEAAVKKAPHRKPAQTHRNVWGIEICSSRKTLALRRDRAARCRTAIPYRPMAGFIPWE